MVDHGLDLVAVEPDQLAGVDLALSRQRTGRHRHPELGETLDEAVPADAEPPQELRRVARPVPQQGQEDVLRRDRSVAQSGGEPVGPAVHPVVRRRVQQTI